MLWKPLFKLTWSQFYRVISLLLLETIFCGYFLDIPAGESRLSTWWKLIFLTNRTFWLVESECLSCGNSFLLIKAFFLLVETIVSSKIRFH